MVLRQYSVLGKAPRILRLIHPITPPDEIVGRCDIARGIGDHRPPAIAPRTPFHARISRNCRQFPQCGCKTPTRQKYPALRTRVDGTAPAKATGAAA